MRKRHVAAMLMAGAALGGLTGLTRADAQPIPACGGEGAMHTIPDGGFARCQGARVLQDGLLWTVIVEVRDDGTFGARFTRPAPAPTDIFVELEAHKDGSGLGEVGVLTGFLPAGQTQVTLSGSFNPADLMQFDCVTQTDAKAINGDKDKPGNRVRVAGGWFRFENCSPPPSTVPSTAPTTDTAPTTSPSSSPGTGVSSVPPTTGAVSSSARVLPATGSDGPSPFVYLGMAAVAGGVILLWARRRAEA